MDDARMMRNFLVTDGRTDEQTDKPILGVGLRLNNCQGFVRILGSRADLIKNLYLVSSSTGKEIRQRKNQVLKHE